MGRHLWIVAFGVAVLVGAGLGAWTWRERARQQSPEPSSGAAAVTLRIEGMTCAGCAVAVKLAAERVAGVAQAVVRLEDGTAVVTFDPVKTTPEAIARTITEQTGFKAAVVGRVYNRL